MDCIRIIEKKRNGEALTDEEITWLIDSYTAGNIPDYQMAAWCMAVYFQGMSHEETLALTLAMARSGCLLDLSSIPGIKVDKHSTGGVGDTVTLVAAPCAAAAGVPVAKMSGRALGATGGTVDKMESIPGYITALPADQFIRQVKEHGIALASQSAELAPADALLYALRDATGTVESIPLIASSIMSKKIASGADAVVLDVKCGRGAFMKDRDASEELAEQMMEIGRHAGKRMAALITDMNIPLGCALGNSVEVDEAVEVLSGGGNKRLRELCAWITAVMLVTGGIVSSPEEGRRKYEQIIRNGSGFDKLKECICAQGGDTSWMGIRPLTPDRNVQTLYADRSGYIEDIDPSVLEHIVMDMGAGRKKKEDPIDPYVGIQLMKEAGDPVTKGEKLALLWCGPDADPADFVKRTETAVRIGTERIEFPLIHKILL